MESYPIFFSVFSDVSELLVLHVKVHYFFLYVYLFFFLSLVPTVGLEFRVKGFSS